MGNNPGAGREKPFPRKSIPRVQVLLLCYGGMFKSSYSVVVITLDFESSDLGSNPSRSLFPSFYVKY